MITEGQKYISGIYKNLGFALLTPIGSIIFQALLFNKPFLALNIIICALISVVSWLLFYVGYNYIKERKNDS